jgi:hypothetical protein
MKSSKYWQRLPGDLWPIHLKPCEDELFSSWLVRFSHAHLLKVETMCSMLWGRQSTVWNRDIDKLATSDFLEAMAKATGTSMERVYSTTLKAYEGWLSEKVNSNGASRWVTKLGVYHRKRRRYGLMYCPCCLSDPETRYFKRNWRLSWSTVCVRHQCNLLDRCPTCSEPVMPHRSDMLARDVTPTALTIITCSSCHADLSDVVLEVASPEAIALQVRLEMIVHDGFIYISDNTNLYSFLYFDGLRVLVAGLQRFWRRYSRLAGLLQEPVSDLESMALAQRRGVMAEVALILDDWPSSLFTYSGVHGVLYSDLKAYSKLAPYWYACAIKPLKNIQLPLSSEERRAVKSVILKRHGTFNIHLARELTGRRWR